MTGKELLTELKKIEKDNPEQLDLEVFHIHTEYGDPEDSMGVHVEQEIDSISVEFHSPGYGSKPRPIIRVGY
jgi:hypothetical protein